jgi:precorrin-6B methylase 2
MNTKKSLFKLIMSALLFIITSCLVAQEKQTIDGYTPRIGQQGKDVVWVPTPQELINKMLEIAEVKPDDYVIDLGSGDGRTVIAAAKIGAKALGVEYNPDMVELSKENARKEGVSDKAEFIKGDLYETDLSKATVITMFLLPEINLKLRPRLLDLKPGTRIVSNTFTMGEWEADYKVTTEENWNSWNTAHLWIIPAKVEGTWKLGKEELKLFQKFQFVIGTLSSKGKSYTVTEGKLHGNSISFMIDGKKYSGLVNDDTMTGTYTNDSGGAKSDWDAMRVK